MFGLQNHLWMPHRLIQQDFIDYLRLGGRNSNITEEVSKCQHLFTNQQLEGHPIN